MSANQIKVLDSVNFPWSIDSSGRWDGHYQELIAYTEANGHTNVPRKDGKLGIWVKNQRAAYFKLQDEASGRRSDDVKKATAIITSDQIKLLDQLGFQWKMREEHSDVWGRHFDEMKAFIEEHRHNNPKGETHPNLCRWVCKQRYRYKLKAKGEKTAITDEQILKLDGIGFKWDKVLDSEEKKRKKDESNKRRNEQRKEKRRAEAKLKQMEEKEAATPVKKKQKVIKSPPPLPKGTKEPVDWCLPPLEAANSLDADASIG